MKYFTMSRKSQRLSLVMDHAKINLRGRKCNSMMRMKWQILQIYGALRSSVIDFFFESVGKVYRIMLAGATRT